MERHAPGTIRQPGAFAVAKLWDAVCMRLFARGSRDFVKLDRMLIGHQDGIPLERWVRLTGEWSRVLTR
jgi:hypothetical protein